MSKASGSVLRLCGSSELLEPHYPQKTTVKKKTRKRSRHTKSANSERPIISMTLNKKELGTAVSCTRRNVCKEGVAGIDTESLKSYAKTIKNDSSEMASYKQPVPKVVNNTNKPKKKITSKQDNTLKERMLVVCESSHNWDLPVIQNGSTGSIKTNPKSKIKNINDDIAMQKLKLSGIPRLKNITKKKPNSTGNAIANLRQQIGALKSTKKSKNLKKKPAKPIVEKQIVPSIEVKSHSNIVNKIDDALKGGININNGLLKKKPAQKKNSNTIKPEIIINEIETVVKPKIQKPKNSLKKFKLATPQKSNAALSISDTIIRDDPPKKASKSNTSKKSAKTKLALKSTQQGHPIMTIVDKLTAILKQIETVLNEENNYSAFIREKMDVIQTNLKV